MFTKLFEYDILLMLANTKKKKQYLTLYSDGMFWGWGNEN